MITQWQGNTEDKTGTGYFQIGERRIEIKFESFTDYLAYVDICNYHTEELKQAVIRTLEETIKRIK